VELLRKHDQRVRTELVEPSAGSCGTCLVYGGIEC
jgi:hypothetical protein